MAEALSATLYDNPDIKELLKLLESPDFQAQRREYESLLAGVDAIIRQYSTILAELDALKEKVSQITDRKSPLAVMVERLENTAAGIGEKLQYLKDSVISFTKNTLDAVKEKGLSALGTVFDFLHVKDGLQAMSNGLAKSVEGLNKAVARVENLEQHNREKVAVAVSGEIQPPAEQTLSLTELLADTRMDFENLTPEELKATYEKLLSIGMNNDMTVNELNCLQDLTESAESLLPDRGETESARELEIEAEQGEEI